MNQEFDCIIIGGGPGGLVASIYLQRFRRKTLIVDKDDSRLKLAPWIHNLVGYSKGIAGQSLLNRLRQQAKQYNVSFVKGEGVIYRQGSGFEVHVEGTVYKAKYVIVATGFKDIQLPRFDYKALCGHRAIAYCPICDGYEQTGKTIAVFINSSAGFRKLKILYNFSSKIHVVLLKDIEIPKRHLEKLSKYKCSLHRGRLDDLRYDCDKKLLNIKLHQKKSFNVDMAYVALGMHVPSEATQHLYRLRKNKQGLILVNQHQETSIKGLYAVGDCVKSLSQVSVAVGGAAIAATDIHNQLGE